MLSALFYCILNFHFKDEIICTPLHPFYVVGVGFKHAKDLRLTDLLLTAQGKCAKIQSIEVESLDAPETTYNLEVEDFHTYYVSDNNILVHNACFDSKKYADYSVKYKAEGKTFKAYHQTDGPHKNLFIAKDGYGHGKSSFKLLKEVSGSKLELIGDLDSNGVFMTAKHSSNVGLRYSYFGKRLL